MDGGSNDALSMSLAYLGALAGLIGALSGVVALALQVWSRRRTAHRVVVVVTRAYPVYDGEIGDELVCVTASNLGATPVTIKTWGIRVPGGDNLTDLDPLPRTTSLPHRLEVADEASFYLPLRGVAISARERRLTHRHLRAWVGLAGDERAYAKRGVPSWD